MKTVKMIKRQSLIIWLYSAKNIKQLRKHGYIHYYSKRMKYAVMYVDKNEADELMEVIKTYHFVRDIEISHRDSIDMSFSDSIDSTSKDLLDDDLILPKEGDDTLIQSITESLKASLRKKKDN